jgi:hypothetical protein
MEVVSGKLEGRGSLSETHARSEIDAVKPGALWLTVVCREWKKVAAERATQPQKKKTTRRGRNRVQMSNEEFLNELQADEDRDETYYDSPEVNLSLMSSPRATRS